MTFRWHHLVEAFRCLWNEAARAEMLALIDDTREYRYSDLYRAVGRYAGWLQRQGVQPGDRIAIAAERSAQLAIAILGSMSTGACPCPLEPGLNAEELRRRTEVAGFKWIVHDQANRDQALRCGLPWRSYLPLTDEVGTPEYWHAEISPESDGLLLFTSGSSGKPKGVLQNHRGLLVNALGIVRHTSLGSHDKLLHIMPLCHTNGVNNQLLAPLLAGSCVVLAPKFKAANTPQLFDQHRPTIVTGVPTMYSRMLPLDFSPQSLSSLRMLRCGSAPITEELHRRIEEKFGLPLIISYGLSEATCTSTMNPPQARKIGSVGTPLEGQSVFLRDPDRGLASNPGIEGEICIAGPSLMTGYLLDNAGAIPLPLGETLHTGDLGRFDDDSYLFITGRLKDVIIRGGENLSPNLIEEAIAAVPGVAACCVVGKADADLGEVPVAFVVRQRGTDGDSLASRALAEAVREKLPRIYQPMDYFFVDTLPENATGKVDRKKLRDLARA